MLNNYIAAIKVFLATLVYQMSDFLNILLIKNTIKQTTIQPAKNDKNKLIANPEFLIKLPSKVANLNETGAYLYSY